MLLVAGYDHFYCRVSFKNIYICTVYTIFADYIYFPVSGYLSALQASKEITLCT